MARRERRSGRSLSEDVTDVMDSIEVDEDVVEDTPRRRGRASRSEAVEVETVEPTKPARRGRAASKDVEEAPRSRGSRSKSTDEFENLFAEAIVLDPNEVRAENDNEVPDGSYIVTVESIEKTKSKEKGLAMIKSVYKVVEDEEGDETFAGRLMFVYDMLESVNKDTGEITSNPSKLAGVIMNVCEMLGDQFDPAITYSEFLGMCEDVKQERPEILIKKKTSSTGYSNYSYEFFDDEE